MSDQFSTIKDTSNGSRSQGQSRRQASRPQPKETGVSAGIPLFLQRASNSSTPSNQAPQEVKEEEDLGGLNGVSKPIQSKLTIGEAGDPYEQEADEVAD